MSGMMRDKLIELALPSAELAADGLAVTAYGQDWVRVTFGSEGVTAPLRKRPRVKKVPALQNEVSLFEFDDQLDRDESIAEVDLFGNSIAFFVVYWDYQWIWNNEEEKAEGKLSCFSVAQVASVGGEPDYQTIVNEIEISPNVVPLRQIAPPGSANDDDDLDDVVGRWDQEAPAAEEEITDKQDEEGRDDDDTSLGGRG
ncbi:hypothetical protein [Parafrankia sp. FMc2]|uniref:hypothetical protein n=1 Tax=Parafrankia sp. FMc2 TaxID=3233196 RepID=UPI0034D50493